MAAALRATSIMPRVVMNGGMPPAVVTRPFTAPSATPRPMPASAATGPGAPCTSRSAVTSPHSASSDPTDRSMPAEMMTKVSPMPRMALMADCCPTFSRLSGVRKCGEATPSSTTTAASTSSAWARLPQAAAPTAHGRASPSLARGAYQSSLAGKNSAMSPS